MLSHLRVLSSTLVRRSIQHGSLHAKPTPTPFTRPASLFTTYRPSVRLYSTEKKENTEQPEKKPEVKPEQSEQKTEEKSEQKTEAKAEQKTEEKTEQKTEQNTENKTEQTENTEQKTEQEQPKYEELPPWWPTLPLWKKIFYPTLGISLFSLITSLIYQSVLRSTLPYKQALHVIRGVDEIEEAFGEIKEPRWYRFWELLFGYWWEDSSGYTGTAKLWIPITGVTEYKTGKLDKNGEPVMGKIMKTGRAYAEAVKEGAGSTEWTLIYLVVRGEQLDAVLNNQSEWMDPNNSELPKRKKGEMVLVDKTFSVGDKTTGYE